MAKPNVIVNVRTPASIQEAATLFRSRMTLSLAARILRGSSSFGTPRSDSPFAALESDPPQFEVYAEVPISRYSSTVVHLYVWDRVEHRELKLLSLGGPISLGLHGGYLIRRYLEALAAQAPGTTPIDALTGASLTTSTQKGA